METKNVYELKLVNGLPPGTDTVHQLYDEPRQPRHVLPASREIPEMPPINERKGKWISKYLQSLDGATEFDHIVRVWSMFGGSDFAASLAYAVVICINSQTPAGAAAVHGGKVVTHGHHRYYGTLRSELNWRFYGSTAPETVADIQRINSIHSGIWRRRPGTFSSTWEGQMTVIGFSYFETWVRKVVRARRQIPPLKIQEAYPLWGEQLVAHFVTEPQAGSRSFGLNYPRNWKEIEAFFQWIEDFPFEKVTDESQKIVGHEAAESFIKHFCDLWFPRQLHFLGRQIVLTFIPRNCRRRQRLGEPNMAISWLVRFAFKLYIDVCDLLPDPVEPTMEFFRLQLVGTNLSSLEQEIYRRRGRQAYLLTWALVIGGAATIFWTLFCGVGGILHLWVLQHLSSKQTS